MDIFGQACDESYDRLRHQGLQDGVMDIVFAWDAASDGAPPGASQRCVDIYYASLLFLIMNTDYLSGEKTEVTTVVVSGRTEEGFEDAVDGVGVGVGAEDTMMGIMIAETIGTVEVGMTMTIVGVEDVDAVDIAGSTEIDTITEVAVDTGPRPDHREGMAMGRVTQLVATDNLLLLLLLLPL